MKFDNKYIITVAIIGIILLYSYYYYGKKIDNINKLWGRIKGNFINVYYASMLLSAIGFLFLFYYLIVSNSFTQKQINQIFIALILIVGISIIWMPLSIYYLKNKKNMIKILIIAVLLVVALASLYLIYILNQVQENKLILNKKLALLGMIYFFIHAFFFDSLIWSYNFF